MKLSKLILLTLFIALVSCSKANTSRAGARCNVPERAIAQMTGSAAYQYRDDPSRPQKESYSAVLVGQRWFFRGNNPQDSDSQALRSVSKYEAGKWASVPDLRCPVDASWVTCAAAWNPYSFLPANSPMANLREKKPEPVNTPSCDFEVEVAKWTPSPDDEKKREVAAEILKELLEDPQPDSSSTPASGDTRSARVVIEPRERGELRRVYIRDFNLNDPEVHVYFEDSKETWVIRFDFDSTTKPHMTGGGGYGTVTVESVRDWIMEQPYRLYPPPIGKP